MIEKNMEKSGRKEMTKRGQITIFIILALLIVAGILVYFLWVKPTYVASGGSLNIENCMSAAVKDALPTLEKQAGYNQPPAFSYMYMSQKIPYLCYTNLYLQPCINQKPFLKQHFEEEITIAVKDKIYQCYEDSLNDLRSKGYEVIGDSKELNISIEPNQIIVQLKAPVTLSRESSSRFTQFKSSVVSPLYDDLMIATSIVQFESKYGDSDVNTIMFMYPNLVINKLRQSDGTTIYIIQDKTDNNKLQFATRSYAWPAGYGSDTGLLRKQ
jgi:hypothetical protein